ncbi:MAG: hypothetical protein IJB78_01275 [Oscillospiraceae bacterium]|nr:hypothetical protein [Oscillospiraceae bacterium]
MVKILVSIHNGLLAEAMTAMLSESGEFEPFPISAGSRNGDIAKNCEMLGAQMVLMEVSYSNGTAVETRLKEVREIRSIRPECKIVLLCDENSAPDIAQDVMLAKKDGLIDAFFYSSVTAKYLLAALLAL